MAEAENDLFEEEDDWDWFSEDELGVSKEAKEEEYEPPAGVSRTYRDLDARRHNAEKELAQLQKEREELTTWASEYKIRDNTRVVTAALKAQDFPHSEERAALFVKYADATKIEITNESLTSWLFENFNDDLMALAEE